MATGKTNGKKSKKATQSQVKREVAGVCLIALGLFFAVSIYSDAVGIVGNAISDFFFAFFGVLCYILPVLVFALGIAIIAVAKKKNKTSVFVLSAVGILCIMVIIHIYSHPKIEGFTALQYYKEAYTQGQLSRIGGGLFGALPAYPSLLFIGTVGTYIFFCAGALVCFLIVTKLSLRDTAEQMGKTIKAGVDTVTEQFVEMRRGTLYTEDLSNESQDCAPTRKQRRGNQRNVPAITMDDSKQSPQQDTNKVKYIESDLSMLPSSGVIQRKGSTSDAVVIVPDDISEVIPAIANNVGSVSRISQNLPHKPVAVRPNDNQAETTSNNEDVAAIIDETTLEYQRPPYTLLNSPMPNYSANTESPQEKGRLLVATLESFNISARIINISVGPVITRYELQPAQGIRVSRITTLANDIAMALAAPRVRIEAPIPGKAAVGIEVPNTNVTKVLLREIVESNEFNTSKSSIAFALGKDIAGKVMIADLDKMPHLLIAGSTGSGKSVCINDIIISMVYKSAPADVRMILIDPKVVELKIFSALPHLLLPVVTEPKRAAGALKWAVMEMEQRYQKMSKLNARDISRYNSLQEDEAERLPKIVIIIDELADLMMVAAKDVEEAVCRIAQLGRAAGIHLIVATQRPSTDIITGLIKANIPSRIAFMVSSAVDSRVILDTGGAEKLIGKGDMLFHANGANKPLRAQCAYVSDEEVERVMEFFTEQQLEPQLFCEDTLNEIITSGISGAQGNGKQEDELLPDAVKIVMDSGQASISMIQRRLRVGYARAARLIDIMEQMNIVSGFDGSKPRKLLIGYPEYEEIFGNENSPTED
ncbi:MAG: DNA translocase FtsK [Clostridia bacterium]